MVPSRSLPRRLFLAGRLLGPVGEVYPVQPTEPAEHVTDALPPFRRPLIGSEDMTQSASDTCIGADLTDAEDWTDEREPDDPERLREEYEQHLEDRAEDRRYGY